MEDVLIPHIVERSRNRTSRATVQDDKVLIRLARGLSERQEREHIEVLLRRMSKAFVRMQSKASIDPFRPMLEGKTELTVEPENGIAQHFVLREGKSYRSKKITDGHWEIFAPAKPDKKVLHRLLWNTLARAEYDNVQDRMLAINARTVRARIPAFRLRIASSKWGSCSRRSGITLNTALLFLSEEAFEYVIVHELCHFPHPNHSRAFWNEVEHWMPDYKEAMKVTKGYRLLRL